MSAWLTTIVVPVSALFCRKMSEKVNLSMETYQKKGKAFWQVLKQAKACGFNLGFFCHANFSNLTNVFVSVIVFPPNHVIRVSLTFLASEMTITVKDFCSHFEWHMRHVTLTMAAYLFQVHVESFWQKYSIGKTWFFTIHVLLYNKQKKIRHTHFSRYCLNFKKTSTESDQHHVPVQKIKQLAVYHL